MTTDVLELRKENKAVLEFIKDYMAKNEYNPQSLDEYNAKFKTEFNDFLTTNNFSKETIEFFKN